MLVRFSAKRLRLASGFHLNGRRLVELGAGWSCPGTCGRQTGYGSV
jgi:hypothetical protein